MFGFITTLLNPLLLLWALVVATLFFWRRGRRRWMQVTAILGGLWLFLISVSPLPIWLAYRLERQYPVLDPSQLELRSEASWHIVVLGGGHTHAPALTAANQLSAQALGRLVEGVRLYHRLPGSKLVVSGYSQSGRTTQAELLARAARDLGVREEDVLMMPQPRQTREEAHTYATRFGKDQPLILVTSAIHMPRSVEWFRIMGLHPVPAPADHVVKRDPEKATFHFRPQAAKIGILHQALHEYAGMVQQNWMR